MATLNPRDVLMHRLRRAFLDHGYEQLTMTGLADAADMSRRALYNHVSSKEEAFRAVIRWGNERDIARGLLAAASARAEGASVLEILVAFTDARYGETRRELSTSPHAVEINDQAFRRCRDVMIDAAVTSQERLADLLTSLENAGLVRWSGAFSAAQRAQIFSDAARGVNQTLPPRPAVSLPDRYREIFAALLHGVTLPGADPRPTISA